MDISKYDWKEAIGWTLDETGTTILDSENNPLKVFTFSKEINNKLNYNIIDCELINGLSYDKVINFIIDELDNYVRETDLR